MEIFYIGDRKLSQAKKEYDDIIFNEYDEDDLTRLETTLIALATEYVDAAIEIRKIKEGM